jgi:hypothetical protein
MPTNHIKVPLGLRQTEVICQETSPEGPLRVVVGRTTVQDTCPRCG